MAKKRTLKNFGRRGLALFLSMVMTFSMMQLQVFAGAAVESGAVMDGSFVLNTDGSVAKNEDGTDKVITGVGHDTITYAADGFTLSKSAQKVDGMNDTFDITLQVVTSQTVTTNDAAIQLVIDTSGSMAYCADCGNDEFDYGRCDNCDGTLTRMQAVKNAVNGTASTTGFLDSILASHSASGSQSRIFVSVVDFASGVTTACGWKDITTSAGLAAVKSAVNGLTAGGGTNIEGGLMVAKNRLSMNDIATVAASNKYTVFLGDGAPTWRVYSTSNNVVSSTTGINSNNCTSDSDGTGTSANERNEAVTQATAVKALSKLYTICFGVSEEYLYGTDSCIYCNKTKAEHNHVMRTFWGYTAHYYYCSGTSGNEYEGGYVTVGEYLRDEIATPASGNVTYAYNAENTAQVNAAFADIASSSVAGMTGGGTTVTDPMPANIVLDTSTISFDDAVPESGSTITWVLDPEDSENVSTSTSGNVTTYTYTLTYRITLNTAAPGFVEDQNYPTNGYTYLHIPAQGDAAAKDLAFPIPGVSGKTPEVNWSLEYYIQDDAALGDYDNYTHVKKFDAEFGPVDIWTSVYVPDYVGDVYMNKFDSLEYEYHTFETGNVVMRVEPITEDHPENVMRVYYKRTSDMVNVNHFYKTDEWTAEGEFIEGTYPVEPQTHIEEPWTVCEEYTATPQYSLSGADYELDDDYDNIQTITVNKGGVNTINLYYTREVDNREEVSAEVRHRYITYGYELNEDTGRYEKVITGDTTVTAQQGSELRATTRFGVDPEIRVSPFDASYELNETMGNYSTLTNEGGELSFTLSDESSENVRTLVYEKTVDNRDPITISVNHHYTKYVTTVEGGKVVEHDPETNDVVGDGETWYVGETFRAVEAPSYGGKAYEPASNNYTDAFVLTEADDGRVINLNYTRTELPESTTILVNHYFRTITNITREETETVTNEDGTTSKVVVGTWVDTVTTPDNELTKQTESPSLYEGQSYEVAPDGEGGYTFNAAYSLEQNGLEDWIVEATHPNQLVINLYYDKTESEDAREPASISVEHIYTTYLTSVVDGKVVENAERYDGNQVESYPGSGQDMRAGDKFTATPDTSYGSHNDYVLVGAAPAEITLQPGSNGKIVINYKRYETQLTEATYAVNYKYNVYQMVVNPAGETEYVLDPVNSRTASFAPAEGEVFYVGEDVTLDAGNKAGFTPSDDNPGTTQRLAASGNSWTFVHEKRVDLPQNTVTVNHYYTTTTIAADGSSSDSETSVLGTPVTKYVGQTVPAVAVPNGFTLVSSELIYGEVAAAEEAVQSSYNVVVTEQPAVVNFYYELTNDNSVPVDYEIRHEYYLYDYNGTQLSMTEGTPVTGTAYLGNSVTGTPTPNGYELVGATYNGDELAAPYTISLQEDDNVIRFRYELTLPRDMVDVRVIHNYYQDEAAVLDPNTDPISVFVETTEEPVAEDTEFTATERVIDGYEFHSADPESKSITVVDDVDANGQTVNVIVLNYVRQEASYKVVHEYYVVYTGNASGTSLDGATESEPISGFVGDVIDGDTIKRVPTYNGVEYTFNSITDDVTLSNGVVPTITLKYNRVQFVPFPEPGINLTKTAPATANLDGTYTYTLKVEAINYLATNVTVTDVLPEGIELVAEADAPYTYDAATRTLTWSVESIPVGSPAELRFTVRALQVGTIENTATVEATVNGEELTDEDDATTQVNGPDTFTLTVKKTVSGISSGKYASNSFTVSVDVSKAGKSDAFWATLAAEQNATYDAAAKALVIEVTAGGSTVLSLPIGEYTVTETAGYNLADYAGTTVNGVGGRSIDVALEENVEVIYNNMYQYSSGGGSDPEPPVIIPGGGDDGDDFEDLGDEDVPLAGLPDVDDGDDEELEDLFEEDVPLAELPATGETVIYHFMAATSAMGLAALAITGRKREEEEDA